MKITSAEFVTSAPTLKEAPVWNLPEIALLGRSNVGKSSFINQLVQRKNLAKTSNTPGKTRLMNFYTINNRFAFVDLPGYGYAKVSKAMQSQWQKHLEAYLQKRAQLVLAVLLLDARHGPQPNDIQMLHWLVHQDIPTVLVLTKVDKIPRNLLEKQVQQATRLLGVGDGQVFPFSAQTGWGKDAIWSCLSDHLETRTVESPTL